MFQGAPASLGVTDRTIAMEGRDENYMEKRARREDNHGQPGPVAGHMVLDLNLAPGDIRTCHVVPRRLFVRNIPCRRSWDSLSTRDKLFAHHFAKASWAGSRICARQLSPVSHTNAVGSTRWHACMHAISLNNLLKCARNSIPARKVQIS